MWKYTQEEKPFLEEVLTKHANAKGFVNYDQFKLDTDLWNKLVVVPKRSHTQIQQVISRYRAETGRTMKQFARGRNKTITRINKPKRKYTRRAKIPAQIVEAINPKYQVHYCPNCGCNIEAVNVAVNMKHGHE